MKLQISLLVLLSVAIALSCSSKREQVSTDATDTTQLAEESEQEETEGVMKQRNDEDSVTYSELGMYDGTYEIETESEGVNSTLKLEYNGDKTFNYEWSFKVAVDEATCNGQQTGLLAMDRTQHGADMDADCILHFNFMGHDAGGYIVEIAFADESACKTLEGECIFSGTYAKK